MKLSKFAPSPNLRCWPVLALVAAAFGAPAWAGPVAAPFKANIVTQETLGYDPLRCPLAGIVGTTTGSGQASQLGVVKMVATDCPLLAPGVLPSFSDGVLTLTAANGDLVRANYQGALHPVAGVPDLYSIVGDFSVTGGTGRFAGARGSGTLQGTITLGPLVSKGAYEVTGTLSY
jgi:hypothetical protein